MTKSVLLLGGFGNIGGRFSAFLTETTSHRISISSRVSRTPPPWAPGSTSVICDLADLSSLDAATRGIDTVYHFASLNDRDSIADPRLAHEVNVVGTKNLVNVAIDNGVKNIVYMSTIHVYGNPLVGLIDENSPTNPSHPYGLTHLEAEDILRSSSADIQSVIVRSGNGFGYPMSANVDIWHIIVNDLCTQAVRSERLTLRSPSNIERNFVTLHDICRALFHLENALDLKPSSTFNIGSTKSRTLRFMAELVASRYSRKFAREIEIVESVRPTEHETSLNFDSTKIRQTGFSTIEDFESEIDGILEIARTRSAR